MKLSVALTLTALAFVLIGGQQAMAGNESEAQEGGVSTKSHKSIGNVRPSSLPNRLKKNWQGVTAPGSAANASHSGTASHSGLGGDNNGYIGKPPTSSIPSFQPSGNAYQAGDSVAPGDISEDDMTYLPMEPTPRPPTQWQIQQSQQHQDFMNAVNRPPQFEPSSIESFGAEWSKNSNSQFNESKSNGTSKLFVPQKGNKPAGNSRVFAPDKTNKPIDSSANNLNKDTTTEKTEKPVGEANESQPK